MGIRRYFMLRHEQDHIEIRIAGCAIGAVGSGLLGRYLDVHAPALGFLVGLLRNQIRVLSPPVFERGPVALQLFRCHRALCPIAHHLQVEVRQFVQRGGQVRAFEQSYGRAPALAKVRTRRKRSAWAVTAAGLKHLFRCYRTADLAFIKDTVFHRIAGV